jgi:hypothetical protein
MLGSAATASAYYETFSGDRANNSYIQNPHHAHSFTYLSGDSPSIITLACQLFNYSGQNSVTHGTSECSLGILPGAYVYARVYNQSGSFSAYLTGYAAT